MLRPISSIPDEPPSGGAALLASQLKNWKKSGFGYVACCPAHDDHTPSLSINEDDEGKLLLHCHAGCDQGKVIRRLIRMGLWPVRASTERPERLPQGVWQTLDRAPDELGRPRFRNLFGQKPDEIYSYRDTDGSVIGYNCRFNTPEGKKYFQPVTPGESRSGRVAWRVQGFNKPTPLFGAQRLSDQPNSSVLVVEGEKTQRRAQRIYPELVVVSWLGGTGGVKHADWKALAGRDVLVWPDADEPGKVAAATIATILRQVGVAHVRVVALPSELPAGWDLADPIPRDLDLDALIAKAAASDNPLSSYIISSRKLSRMVIPPRQMLLGKFLAASSINLLFAPRGAGKTWVAMTVAKQLALGCSFLGFEVPEPRRVLYVDGELPMIVLQERLRDIGAHRINGIDILPSEPLFRDGRPLNINEKDEQTKLSEMLADLQARNRRPDLIIFDNLSALRAGVDENDNNALDSLLRWLLELRHNGYAILLLHHAGKSGDQRGASRLEDFLDTTMRLDPKAKDQSKCHCDLVFTKTRGEPVDPDRLELELKKDEDGLLDWTFGESTALEPSDHTLRVIYKAQINRRPKLFRTQDAIAEAMKLTKSAVSKHCSVLTASRFIEHTEKGIRVPPAGIARLRKIYPEDFELRP